MSTPQRRSAGFLLAYALANAGGVLSYLPFLSLLLPLKVEALVGPDRVAVLSFILIGGAVAASVSNILAGMLIDRSYARGGGRRRWIVLGVVAMTGAYGLIMAARTPMALFGAVMAFQLAVNLALAPIGVMMVDEVPDGQKGLAGGLLALGQPLAMSFAVVLVSVYARGEGAAYVVVVLGVALLVAPVLVTRAVAVPAPREVGHVMMARRDLVWIGLSRLFIMTANSLLSGVLVYYFETLSSTLAATTIAQRVGTVGMLACAAAVPVAVTIGALPADGRRRKLLILGAALASGGALLAMVLAPSWQVAAVGYGLFVCALQVYASQHSAILAQALRSPAHRARDLGWQNLANTVPSVIGPGLVLGLHVSTDLHGLIWVMLALVAGCVVTLARVRVV